jgi:hypothetical protein
MADMHVANISDWNTLSLIARVAKSSPRTPKTVEALDKLRKSLKEDRLDEVASAIIKGDVRNSVAAKYLAWAKIIRRGALKRRR